MIEMIRALSGWALLLCLGAASSRAADLQRPRGRNPALFSPTSPEGVASEDFRSPLDDLIVNGDVRFASAAEARARCPGDAVVWVELGSTQTRSAADRPTGVWPGAFMCQADASIEGDRP